MNTGNKIANHALFDLCSDWTAAKQTIYEEFVARNLDFQDDAGNAIILIKGLCERPLTVENLESIFAEDRKYITNRRIQSNV